MIRPITILLFVFIGLSFYFLTKLRGQLADIINKATAQWRKEGEE